MTRPEKGRGLFYTRDSGGKHEMTPGQYLLWAHRRADDLGVDFSGDEETIYSLIKSGLPYSGDIYLDYDVKGNLLSRPGLNALLARIAADETVTHVFIPRRDRLSRPDDPAEGLLLETSLRKLGVSIVFTERILGPLRKGARIDIGDVLTGIVEYENAGQDRRTLADKIINAQLGLAKAGYSIGGRARYGFCRWLVRADGTQVRRLEDGERVRMRGHHVVWLPQPIDHPHMQNILRILEMLKSLPGSRVAAIFTAEGIPSPDAGRWRKDNDVRHPVSGVWHQTTIMNIARNPLLLALCATGRRSMGDQLRYTPEGPRALTDSDFRQSDGEPKVVQNPESNWVVVPAHFDKPLVDPEQHRKLFETLDKRAGSQRGKARSHDPAKNPLGARIFDLNCTWPMYREPYNGSFRYKCGAYMQSHGQVCEHHHVDGPTVTRFALHCLLQRANSPSVLAKLRKRLHELARQEHDAKRHDDAASSKQAELARLSQDLTVAGRNMTLAKSKEQYEAMARVFDDLVAKKKAAEAEIAIAQALTIPNLDPDAEVEAAIAALDRLPRLVEDKQNLAALGEAFRLVNVRLFFGFQPVQVKNRTLNKLTRGIVTFGSDPPPVRLYEGPTGRRAIAANTAALVVASPGGDVTLPDRLGSGREGKSLGNVNRGDRTPIELFAAGVACWCITVREHFFHVNLLSIQGV